MKNKVTVTVIVPTYQRNEALKRCLASLTTQTQLPQEIIVVDNSPCNEAKKVVDSIRYHNIKLKCYWLRKSGSPLARNFGIKKARGSVLAFIDDDCVAGKNWIRQIGDFFQAHRHIVLLGRNENGLPDNLFASLEHYTAERVFRSGLYKIGRSIYSPLIDSKNFATEKELLVRNKMYFNQKLTPFSRLEDMDLGLRLTGINIKIKYDNKAMVSHFSYQNVVTHIKKAFNKGRAFYYFDKLWPDRQFLSGSSLKIYRKLRKQKENQASFSLMQEIFKNKNLLFKLSFYFFYFVDKLFIATGYQHARTFSKYE